MAERLTAWQCIGCGKIDAPQTCIGVCRDRKVEFVYASDYEEVIAQLAIMRQRTETLVALIRQLACTTPRDGQWELTYRALQVRAKQALKALDEQLGPT